MTFPFSTHNYQIRFWMAAGGVDPDEDVQLVVLPPSYMVDSLSSRQVDGFCVGAPWNSIAVQLGIGRILHFGCDIFARAPEKVLAVRAAWAANRADALERLLGALSRAAAFINDPAHDEEVAALLAAPNRVGVAPEIIHRTLKGALRTTADGLSRSNSDYILIGGSSAARPEPVHAMWLYAQMVRWRQARLSSDLLIAAKACFRPDLYEAALGETVRTLSAPPDGIGAFVGPAFDGHDIAGHLAALQVALHTR
jgi:two-component system, oxyanion-binding sensor